MKCLNKILCNDVHHDTQQNRNQTTTEGVKNHKIYIQIFFLMKLHYYLLETPDKQTDNSNTLLDLANRM